MSQEFRDLLLCLVFDFRLLLEQEGPRCFPAICWHYLTAACIWGSLNAPLGHRAPDEHDDHPPPILHAGYVRSFSLHRIARPAVCARPFLLPLYSVMLVSNLATRTSLM